VEVCVVLRGLNAVAVVVVCLLMPSLASAQTWREVKTANFTVISDAPERRIRTIAWQFEQMRGALAQGLPWVKLDLERPVTIIAVKDENGLRALAPQYWTERLQDRPHSVFVTGIDRHYIALRADVEVEAQGMNPHYQAYWAYSALVLQHSLDRRLPLWVVNGLASVLANTIVRAREVEFGKPTTWIAAQAKTGPRLPLADLLGVTYESAYYRGGVSRERFDAQSWALIQFMIFGMKDNAGPRFAQLIQRLAAGASSTEAIAAAYGSMAALEDAYLLYVQQSVFAYGRLPLNTGIVEGKLAVGPVSVASQSATRAAFHAAMRQPAEGRVLLAAARKADPALPAIDDADGLLFETENQPDEAREAYARAVAGGSTHYWSHYRLATLRASGAQGAEQIAAQIPLLERATTLNPRFVPAMAYLAELQAGARQMDSAIASARRVVELDGSSVEHHVRLARILAQASRVDEARQIAKQALPFVTSPQQRTILENILGADPR
jgi:tetratricopeptide (TPR) repeat protein